jgi:hypothetical protein
MIWIAAKVGFWVTSAAKDTSLWVIGTAFATFFSLNNVSTDKDYVRKIILDNIKFILIIEFVLNLYTFNLAIEFFLLVPLITFVVILNAFAALKPEYKGVKTFLEYVLAIIGFVLLIYTFREIVIHFQDFATAKTLRDFMLPPAFSVSLIPCLYFMALFMQYETLFVRINFANRHSDYAKMIKRKTIMICHLNLAKLIRFSRNLGYPKVNSTDEMEDLIKRGISNS